MSMLTRQKVHVAVRCRPRFHYGLSHRVESPENNLPDGTTKDAAQALIAHNVTHPTDDHVVEINEQAHTIRVKEKTFTVDTVIPPYSTQKEVFDQLVGGMLDEALRGIHTTIFAYGQTGSGKTHTMEGYKYVSTGTQSVRANFTDTSPDDLGVIPRTIESLFQRLRSPSSRDSTRQYKIKCSYYQIYNEKVIDLLNPASSSLALMNSVGPHRAKGPGSGAITSGLRVRWAKHDRFYVENLFIYECESAEQVLELFRFGVKNKCMASHHMNYQSSRSHCVFTIYLLQWDRGHASPVLDDDSVITSEITLVDLAGSEKLSLLSKNPSPQLIQESIDINTSLLALGKVVTALAEQSEIVSNDDQHGENVVAFPSHVPYRDSKLTRLLKHALGGNSVTLMIACINPCEAYVDETLSTLYYAGRARNITNEPKVNEDTRCALIKALRAEIQSLKLELQHYSASRSSGLEPLKVTNANSSDSCSNVDMGTRNQYRSDGTPETTNEDLIASVSVPPNVEEKVYQSVEMIKELIEANSKLRTALDQVAQKKRRAENQVDVLMVENSDLRERTVFLESLIVREETRTQRESTLSLVRRGNNQQRSTSTGAVVSPSRPSRRQHVVASPNEEKRASAGGVPQRRSRSESSIRERLTRDNTQSVNVGGLNSTSPHSSGFRHAQYNHQNPRPTAQTEKWTRNVEGKKKRSVSSGHATRVTRTIETRSSPSKSHHTRTMQRVKESGGPTHFSASFVSSSLPTFASSSSTGVGSQYFDREMSTTTGGIITSAAPYTYDNGQRQFSSGGGTYAKTQDTTPLSAVALAALRRVAGSDGKHSPLLFCGSPSEVMSLEERRRERQARVEALRHKHEQLLNGNYRKVQGEGEFAAGSPMHLTAESSTLTTAGAGAQMPSFGSPLCVQDPNRVVTSNVSPAVPTTKAWVMSTTEGTTRRHLGEAPDSRSFPPSSMSFNTSTNTTGTSQGSTTFAGFQYLGYEESMKRFTPEQLALLAASHTK